MLDVIFMGTPDYAQKILDTLIQDKDINVVAVYTQPDKPVGRKKIMTPPTVKVLAEQNSIDVYQPNRLRDEDVVDELLKIKCDYIVVAAYGQILPKKILDHAPCINLHASILPQYRGASPIQQTLLNGDKQTGVTAMLMEEGLDTGDILKIQKMDVPDDMMVEELFESLTTIAQELTIDVLKNFSTLTPIKQDDSLATHCKKITKKDGEIDLKDAKEIYNKYRAFTPWPGIYLPNGIKLKKISLEETSSKNSAGKILVLEKDSVVISCEIGSIRVYLLQPQSKKEMNAFSYVNGKRLSVADSIL